MGTIGVLFLAVLSVLHFRPDVGADLLHTNGKVHGSGRVFRGGWRRGEEVHARMKSLIGDEWRGSGGFCDVIVGGELGRA